MYNIGIDLGGTNIAVGVVSEDYKIVGRSSVKTNAPRPDYEIADSIKEAVELALLDAKLTLNDIDSIGIGSPGVIDSKRGIIKFANNLKFENSHMAELLSKRLNSKEVYLANDANAAAYGEFIAGAGKGASSFVVVTLGTGVGGGIIINNKLVTGFNYAGAELGHFTICHDGLDCSCGRKGCLEAYASATALIRQTKEAMEKNPDSLMWQECGGDINNVSGRTAFNAMYKGDTVAKEVVDTFIYYLSVGITDIVNMLQPEIICIGGGISKEGATLTDPINKYVWEKNCNFSGEDNTIIKTAELLNDAGIIGAAFIKNSL